MILIGSRALQIRAPGILNKAPVDFDYISSKNEALNFIEKYKIKETPEYIDSKIIIRRDPPIEFEDIDLRPSSKLFYDIVKSDSETIETKFGLIPNLDLLFTLKSSHKYLKNSPFFWKTAIDYHKLKEIGCKIRPEYLEFFKMREKETYNYSHPKLNVTKEKFFSEEFNVKYIYEHDDLHKAVAIGYKPAYLYYAKDGEQVLSDKKKFYEVSEEIRLNGAVEEAAVLAIERSLIPHPGKMTPKQAWIFAISKVASSITSNWFRSYIYENIFEILKRYPENYFEKFKKELEKGNIKYAK